MRLDTIFHKGARLAGTIPTYDAALASINFPLTPAEKRRFHRGYALGGCAQRLQDLLSLTQDLRIDQLEALKPELDELYERYMEWAGIVEEGDE